MAERLELLIKLRLEHCRSEFEASSLGENWTLLVAHLREQGAAAGKRLPESLPPAEGSELADWQKIATTLTTASGSPRKQLGPAAGFYSGFSKTEWAEAIQTLSTEALDHLQSVKALPSSSESTSNLDPYYAHSLLTKVRARVDERGLTVVSVFHDFNLASLYCDEVIFIKDGRVVKSGETAHTLTPENIKYVFNVNSRMMEDEDRKFVIPYM